MEDEHGEIVAYCVYRIMTFNYEALRIAVHPSCWRRGYATDLIDVLKSRLGGMRVGIAATVSEECMDAGAFFTACGFEFVGRVQPRDGVQRYVLLYQSLESVRIAVS